VKADERRWLDRVAGLGCVVCRRHGITAEAEIHHLRTGRGMGERSPHWLTIPLCPAHHRGKGGFHDGPRSFEAANGSELDLLAETIALVARGMH
jgi:hypothetical protein